MTQEQLNNLYGPITAKSDLTFYPAERLDFAHEVIRAVQSYVQNLPSPRQDELDYLKRAEQAAEHGDYTSNKFPGLVDDVRAALNGTNPNDRSQFIWGVVSRLYQREVKVDTFPAAATRLGEVRQAVINILPA